MCKLSTFTTIPNHSYPILSITLQRSKHIYKPLLHHITSPIF